MKRIAIFAAVAAILPTVALASGMAEGAKNQTHVEAEIPADGLSIGDFKARAAERAERSFVLFDKDGNGLVTREEIRAAREDIKGKHGKGEDKPAAIDGKPALDAKPL